MKIGCPREIKPQEFRVGMTPATAGEAVRHGHEVLIETGAGLGAGFADADYVAAGASIAADAEATVQHYAGVDGRLVDILSPRENALVEWIGGGRSPSPNWGSRSAWEPGCWRACLTSGAG